MLGLAEDSSCPLPGDSFLDDPAKQITRTLKIDAPVGLVWPELVAMVRRRRGEGCTLLFGEPPRTIVLGGLYDHARGVYVPFDAPRPGHFWQATWALVLSPLGAARTRLDTRSRVAFTPDAVRWASVWTHPFSDFMRHEELERLKRRAEAIRRG